MKMVRTGSPLPEMTMQHCTDATTDKDMSDSGLADGEANLLQAGSSRRRPTATSRDSVCSVAGISMTSHSEITGDFNSAYTVKTDLAQRCAAGGLPRDTATTIEAKWLGACKAGPEARRHRDARRLQVQRQGRRKAQRLLPAEVALVLMFGISCRRLRREPVGRMSSLL